MGVYHFMGVGFSVGAVTCAVDYIEKALELNKKPNPPESIQRLFKNSGGINHSEKNAGYIEALVLFSSDQVINDKEALNYWGNNKPKGIRSEIKKQLKKVWINYSQRQGRKIYWCKVDINSFDDCFNRILQVTNHFSHLDAQGKEIWFNLTGGSNLINLSLMSIAQLTSASTKQYAISQGTGFNDRIEVPSAITINPNNDNYFNIMPFIPISINSEKIYSILKNLYDEAGNKYSCKTSELYSIFKQENFDEDISLSLFENKYMLKLYGLGLTDFNSNTDENNITEEGMGFMNKMKEIIDRIKFIGNTEPLFIIDNLDK